LILCIKRQLLDTICEQWTEETYKLIRKHDKKLDLGDFSFPSLNNDKVWAKYQLKTKSLKQIQDSSAVIKKLSESGQTVVVNLDRTKVYDLYFGNPLLFNDAEKMSKVKNFDIRKPNSSEITSARAFSISEVLVNLPKTSNHTVAISSTDLASQIQSIDGAGEDCEVRGVRVGAVLGDNDKKETKMTFSDYKKLVLEDLTTLDEERRDESEPEQETERRLTALVEANIQFQLLGSNISQPVKLQTSKPSSSFVLYNLARMKQILRTFEQLVTVGHFPRLPAREHIDFTLLTEAEEWELMFTFLLSFPDVVTDCSRALSLHKLVTFLCGFANTFSRYYNRVKILKDPLPHLIPAVHAKIFLVEEISSVLVDALDLLNIKYVAKM